MQIVESAGVNAGAISKPLILNASTPTTHVLQILNHFMSSRLLHSLSLLHNG